MSRTPIDQLIPRADKHIVRAFPRVAQRLENSVDEMDRSEMETFLKILPGAIERFQAVVTPQNDLHESVEGAILQLVASFPRKSFESQPASEVEPVCQNAHSNTPIDPGETADGDSESELPNGSDTSQQSAFNTLPSNDLEAAAGNGGESDSKQAGPRNPRVRRGGWPKGRRRLKLMPQVSGESADDRG